MISLNKYSETHNIEKQALAVLVKEGLVPVVKRKRSKAYRYFLPEDHKVPESLVLRCECCGKGMVSITANHFKVCKVLTFGEYQSKGYPLYSEFGLKRKKKTDSQKKAQSVKLKERFKTPAGEATRRVISEKSKATRRDPEFRANVSRTVRERYENPEARAETSRTSQEMWDSPGYREKRGKYVEENIDSLRASAANARKHLKKTSKLHLRVKSHLEKMGVHSETEYFLGYYHIDEAIPEQKIAIEVDGCYWHGCVKCGLPGVANIKNIDKRKSTYLTNRGWKILRVKECSFNKTPTVAVEEIIKAV